jgi:hypothetical protein
MRRKHTFFLELEPPVEAVGVDVEHTWRVGQAFDPSLAGVVPDVDQRLHYDNNDDNEEVYESCLRLKDVILCVACYLVEVERFVEVVHEYGFVLADGVDVLPRLLLDDLNQALDQLRLIYII